MPLLSFAIHFTWLAAGFSFGTDTVGLRSPASVEHADSAIRGRTIDIGYDGKDIHDPKRAYTLRMFIHDSVPRGGQLPVVVFFHGLNKDQIPFRWMGGGTEGDVRRIVGSLLEQRKVAPHVLIAPSSVVKEAVAKGSSFPVFDFDKMLALAADALKQQGWEPDLSRVVVTGHSGAGCSERGGILSGLRSMHKPVGVVSIDTCMGASLAQSLGGAPPQTHVVVTWQTVSWDRPFELFRRVFREQVAQHPPGADRLRTLTALPPQKRAHDATVKQTFDEYLPLLLPVPP